MAIRGQALTIYYRAFNTSTNQLVANDQANHTLRLSRDGAADAAPTNAPVARGKRYAVALTAAEADCDSLSLDGDSSTPNVVLICPEIITESGEFALVKAKTNLLSSAVIEISEGVTAGGEMTLVAGDDYGAGCIHPALTLTLTGYTGPALASAGSLRIADRDAFLAAGATAADLEVATVVSQDGTTVTISASFTAAQTLGLAGDGPLKRHDYRYQARVTTAVGAKSAVVADGPCTVTKSIGAAS